jgi:hypothetical protein
MITPRAFATFSGNGLMKFFLHTLLFCFAAMTALVAREGAPTVLYTPQLKLIEGDQPVTASYVLSVKSPANVPAGSSLSINTVLASVSAPAAVSPAAALSFVSLSPTNLVFTGPNQTQTTTVTVQVPVGTTAGDYVWSIATTGWSPGTIDPGASINAKVTIPLIPSPPSVALTAPLDGAVYDYMIGSAPLSIPLSFSVSAPAISPITSIDADISGTAVPLNPLGIGTGSVSATGTLSLDQAGVYTVRARATNNAGTSSDTVEITVNLKVPAPVVTILEPTASAFVHTGTPLTIPFVFTSTSLQGGTTALSATLNGTPVTVTALGLGSLLATGSGALTINGAGHYTLVVTGTTANGTTAATKTFTITSDQPVSPPTVTVVEPLEGASFSRVTGSPATLIPFAFSAAADTGSTLTSIAASLNGNSVAVSANGVGSSNATGTGTLSVSTPGSYTFVATAASGSLTGSKSTTFTVSETPAPADCSVNWLPPISLGKVQKGGSGLPIRFTLSCGCDDEQDTSVVIAIYEIFANGSTAEPELFTYSRRGKNSRHGRTYEIDGNHYHLNFETARGPHRYHVDVYRTPEGAATPQLVGTKEFTTR